MKNKLVKSMSMIIAVAMLIAMVPAVVSADVDTTIGTVTVDVGEADEATGSAQVTVTASGITGDMTDYTLLAIRSDDEVDVDDLGSMSDTALEAQIEYIDQDDATVSEGTLTASFTLRGADLAEMKTRTGNYGSVITVLLGGTGVTANGGSDTYELPKIPAPAVSANKTAIYADEAIEITVTDPADGYMAAAKVKVDGTVIDTAAVSDNVITIPAGALIASDEAQAITVECEGYKPTAAINVTVKAVDARFTDTTPKALSVSAYDAENPDANAVVTVPAGYTDEATGVTVAYVSYTVDGGEPTAIEGTSFEVERNDENGAAKAIVVNVTLTYGGSTQNTTVTATVSPKGVVGPVFTADDVQIVEQRRGVYNKTGMSLVIIDNTTADFDVTSGKLVIENDGTQYPLYYNESCNRFLGIVPAYEGEDAAKKSAAKDQIEVVEYDTEETSADYEVYYGKADEDSVVVTSGRLYNTTDLVGIKKIMGRFDNRTDKMYLAADMGEGIMDGQINATDLIEIKLYLGRQLNELRINGGTLAQ